MKSIVLLYFSMFSLTLLSQQLPQYSQWSMNQFAENPAHAGIKRCVDIHSLYRMQWIRFEGAPNSGFLSVSIPLAAQRRKYLSARHGTGFKFETDQIGQFNVNRLSAAYAAHFNFDEYNRLSLGLYGGIMQLGYDPSGLQGSEPDPAAMSEGSIVTPDASFGAWFNAKTYYVGLTLKNLIPSKWNNVGLNTRNRFHASLSAGYQLAINESISLTPAGILRIPAKGPVSIDLNLMMDINNVVGIGVGYRNTDALIALLNIKIQEQFSISYSFDYTLSNIQLGASNTHEISLRYTTCKPRKTSSSSCPLFE
ncbi:MAG: PorP/SprF family type IX secretion system membrane protein [Crocinitomicaceae bacterium]|nr:PorP/SprF family type IX secretion system membrane protein [Crocinitomicaceae bacterium]MDG1776986.1 PorP/SprF family type IX secretion system membrane protein [Crocinitomicaceae bacterium]